MLQLHKLVHFQVPKQKTSICCTTVPTYFNNVHNVKRNISATYFNFCKKIASTFGKNWSKFQVSSIQIIYKIEVSFWQITKKVEVSFPTNLQEILKYVAEQNNGHLKYLFFWSPFHKYLTFLKYVADKNIRIFSKTYFNFFVNLELYFRSFVILNLGSPR